MSEQQGEAARLCPLCGGSALPEASFCPFCGTPLSAATTSGQSLSANDQPSPVGGASGGLPAGSSPATWLASGVYPASPAPSAQATQPTPPASAHAPAAEWRCQWCGAANPRSAERCVACGAAYPSPEQDAAMTRAAEARIRAVTDSLDAMRRRKGFGRFFGS
jgi:hypothetical protein